MKHNISYIISTVALCAAAQSNVEIDSTDLFFRHLDLKEVVVTGATGATKLKDSSAPVTLLTERQLQGVAATNIIDAVASIPGVAQVTTGGGISKPVIRGLGYNRIVVVSDGIRQEGQQWGDEHGIEIDDAAVSTVEVLKGPASLVYGSDALAGVLRLNSAPIVPPGHIRGSVNTQYQTNNGLLGYSAQCGGNADGLVWHGLYSGKHAHAYTNSRDGRVPGTQFAEQAARLMGGVNRHWGHSRLTLSLFHLTPTIAEGERNPETGRLECPYGSVNQYGHGMPYQQVWHYKAALDHAMTLGRGRLTALLGYQLNRRQEFEEIDNPDEYGLYLKLHTASYNVDYTLPVGEGWQITAGTGGMWQRSVNGGEEFLIPDYRLTDIGFYATAQKSVDRWTFNGGARYDHRALHSMELADDGELRFADLRRGFGGLTGSLGAVLHAGEQWDLRANVSRGFRAPNISELCSNGVHEGSVRYELGSSTLKAERSLQIDLGAEFTSPIVAAQAALFVNTVSNYIFLRRTDEVVEPGYDTYRFDSGDSRLWGGEISVDLHPLHALHIGTALAWVNAVQLHQPHESRYLPFTPAPRWTVDAKYEFSHEARTFNNAYVAAGVDCNFAQSHVYEAGDTETPTPAYTLLNISAGTDVMSRGRRVLSLAVIANNLANRAYQSHLSRLKYLDIDPTTGRRGICNMGRNVTIKVTVPIDISL